MTKMRTYISALIVLSLFFSCKKKDDQITSPPPPVTIADSTFKITGVVKTDINEFDVSYAVKPPPNETFSNIYFQWSTSPDFLADKDSVIISTTISQPLVYHLAGIKQATKYYGRIGITYKGTRFYSTRKEWTTDTLKILSVGYWGALRGLNKGDTTVAFTNLQAVTAIPGTGTKIFVGPYECPVISDQGLTISFSVPASTPAGKYIFKIVTRGMEAQAKDSTEVLRGRWFTINSPNIPVNPAATTSGLFSFGTCYSAQNGYMLGGAYFNGPQVPYPNSQYPEFIFEFNGLTKTWTKRYPTSLHYVQNPISYHYNNSIYVIGALERVLDPFGNDRAVILKKILRLDLTSMNWQVMNDVPYPTIYDLTSFELNNEWYIGMGSDSANRSICCGVPLPAKKFWKFNPATNQWTQLADFPGGHQTFPTSFSIGSKGYAFYGAIPIGDPNIATTFTQELWEYNPATNAWSQVPLPATGGPPPGEKYQIASYNGKAYFLTGQVRTLFGTGYGFIGVTPCLEWDPVTGLFKQISFPTNGNIMKTIFKQGNNFYFQSDALGYFESIPNKTYSFSIEQ